VAAPDESGDSPGRDPAGLLAVEDFKRLFTAFRSAGRYQSGAAA
jgi:hypothetical protein